MNERRRCPLAVGLTGGIGAGKSAATALFDALGATVIDADLIARELVEPGQPALTEIVSRFGPQMLTAQGRLDRTRLREWIFGCPERRHLLESILHPRIREELCRRIAAADGPYCLVVIPLLVESGMGDLVDRILVVDAPPEQQIERTARRDGVPAEQVRAILAAQIPREQRLAHADDVLLNANGMEVLRARVEQLHHKYLALAAHAPGRKPNG